MDKIKLKKKNSYKIKRLEKPKVVKGFKTVEWTRKTRDKMYEKYKDLSMSEYVKAITKKVL